MGEIAGFSSYEEVAAGSETLELYGVSCRILTLEELIRSKRAAGRPKDMLLLSELEALSALRSEADGEAGGQGESPESRQGGRARSASLRGSLPFGRFVRYAG